MRSIRQRLVVLVGILVLGVCLGLGVISYLTSYESLKANVAMSLPQFAQEAAKTVEKGVEGYLGSLETIANSELFYNSALNQDEIVTLLSREAERAGHLSLSYADANGKAIDNKGNEEDISGQDYFKAALNVERSIYGPLRIEGDTDIALVYSVPVKQSNGTVGYIIAFRDGYELSGLVADINYGETGKAFIMDADGKTLAHTDKEIIASLLQGSTSDSASGETDAVSSATPAGGENVKGLPGYADFQTLRQKMMSADQSFGEFMYEGTPKYIGFAHFENFDWYVAVEADKAEILAGLNLMQERIFLFTGIFVGAGLIAAFFIASNIQKPIRYLTQSFHTMAEGDFTGKIRPDYLKRKDELGELARAFQKIIQGLGHLLKETARTAMEVASASRSLSKVMNTTSSAVDDVARTVEMIAKGASRQAGETEEGVHKAEEIGTLLEKEKENIAELTESAEEVVIMKEAGFRILNELVLRTETANEGIDGIRKVIKNSNISAKEIEKAGNMLSEITEQTNILALNAAIEAARAGESGRGFAVVAEEVRKLAEESNRFTVEISSIINNLISESEASVTTIEEVARLVASQTQSVEETKEKFNGIDEAVEKTKSVIQRINAYEDRMHDMKQELMEVMKGLSDISEENAAGTEEVSTSVEEQVASLASISLSSEELSALSANLLKDLEHFNY